MSKEEEYLKQIISSCELILDDLEQDMSISNADFNNLGSADVIMLKVQQNVSNQLTPTNIGDE